MNIYLPADKLKELMKWINECLDHYSALERLGKLMTHDIAARDTLLSLMDKISSLSTPTNLMDIEQYRLQMAGISTAAIGYWKEGDSIAPDYDTVALRDVAKLYQKYDELFRRANTPPAMEEGKLIKICGQVAEDVQRDAKEFDGKPFDGKTVATYFGYHGAAIKALADVLKKLIEDSPLPPQPGINTEQAKLIDWDEIYKEYQLKSKYHGSKSNQG